MPSTPHWSSHSVTVLLEAQAQRGDEQQKEQVTRSDGRCTMDRLALLRITMHLFGSVEVIPLPIGDDSRTEAVAIAAIPLLA